MASGIDLCHGVIPLPRDRGNILHSNYLACLMNKIRQRLLLLLFLILLGGLALLFESYVHAIGVTTRAEENRLTSFFVSGELRRSTEDLYTMSKAYLTTSDPTYRKNFEEIIAIRDGLLPRTESYQTIYWGYLLKLNPYMSAAGESVPLVELMERNGFTPEELEKMIKAKSISDELAAIEIEAMNHIATNPNSRGELLAAHLMLSTKHFLKSKEAMLNLISEAQRMANRRCESAIENARGIARFQRIAFVILAIALFIVGWRGWHSERNRSRILETRSNQDPLTEIANRSLLQSHLETATRKAASGHNAVVLGMVDLNKFKEINDRLGHIRGDEVLRMVSSRLRAHSREGDFVARYGGDEFVVVFETPSEQLESTVARMQEVIENAFKAPLVGSFGSIHVGASIGISIFPNHSGSIEELIRTADEAMYQAKQLNGNVRVAEYSITTQGSRTG